jgi:hypothetical protein
MASDFEIEKQASTIVTTMGVTAFNPATSPSGIPRIIAIEERTFSTITATPIIAFAQDPTSSSPLLGRIESQPWFRPLVAVLCIWSVFTTFFTLFIDFVSDCRFNVHCSPDARPIANMLQILVFVPPIALFCASAFILLWPGRKASGLSKRILKAWKVGIWLGCVMGPTVPYLMLIHFQ